MKKIKVETEKCIGCGACTIACDDFFELKEEKVTLKDAQSIAGNQELEVDDLKCTEDAVNVCPAQCITVEK